TPLDVPHLHSFPTRRSSDLQVAASEPAPYCGTRGTRGGPMPEQLIGTVVHYFKGPSVAVVRVTEGALAVGDRIRFHGHTTDSARSEEHTSELQSRGHLVCRL